MSSSSSDASSPRASPSPDPPVARKSSSKKRKADQPEIEVDLALPEPPSKRAKRALKKGKPLPPKPDSDDEDNEKDGGAPNDKDAAAAAAAAKKERSPYGVWIGNLRFTVTRDELRQWLVDNSGGSITPELITRVHLPRGKRGAASAAAEWENKGFAYVDFATYEANLAAIALSETEWYRRRLLIKDATSFEGRPEEHKLKKKGEDAAADGDGGKKEEPEAPVSTSRKIFVGNLGFQATEDDVRELFAPCGEIEWAKLATFEDSGKCKGYGWVKFAEAAAADWAVKGFVKIKEVEETEEDFVDEKEEEEEDEDDKENESDSSESSGSEDNSDSDTDSDSSSEEEKEEKKTPKKPATKPKAAPEKKVKMRKWWVNTLHGRRLKIEHAEDDQTRYKKRYGKGAPQRQQNGDGGAKKPHQGGGDRRQQSFRHNNSQKKWNSRDDAHQEQDGGRTAVRKEPPASSYLHEDAVVARLTGAAVKSEGKKITFS